LRAGEEAAICELDLARFLTHSDVKKRVVPLAAASAFAQRRERGGRLNKNAAPPQRFLEEFCVRVELTI
jgi:hypothetical protein